MPREMKDSGIEWIGEIPAEWEIRPAKYSFSEVKEKNTDGKITNALKFFSGSIIRKLNFDADSDDYVAETITNYTIVMPDTIMINGLNLNYDLKSLRVGLVTEIGIITSAYLALKPDTTKISPKFATYLFKGYETKMAFHNMGAGIRKTLGYKEFKTQPVLYPPLSEQQKIAAYLDSECAKIDDVITKTKATIEEYKKLKQSVITEAVTKGIRPNREMKDSGIEWIGEIPKEWVINKIKHNFFIYAGATPKSEIIENWDGDIVWVTPADYKTDDKYIICGKRNISEIGYNSCGTTVVPIGSIIFSKRAPIGSVAINQVPLCTNQGCLSCVNKGRVISLYYYYAMSVHTEIFNLYGSGTTFKEISADNFSNFYLPCPTINEQQEIANYLDEKCSEIDTLIAKKEQIVTELESYKKSLIYEYVTGKKEVI